MKDLETPAPGGGHAPVVDLADPGETVWPAAALLGALGSGLLSAGAWVGAALDGVGRPVGVVRWTAENAVWGTLFAVAVALSTHAAARAPRLAGGPALADLPARRATAARLVMLAVVCAHFALAAAAAARGELGAGPLLGLVGGLVAVAAVVRAGLRCSLHLGDVPALDPVRVAVLLAAVTLPVTGSLSAAPPSLLPAWRAMLGG